MLFPSNELTAYQGTGEGYFPLIDGMTRRYDAPDLTDGYIGWVAYSFHDTGDGKFLCFTDQCGIRRKPEVITDYSSIQGEIYQEELKEQGKREEAWLRCQVNHLARLLHQATAPGISLGPGEQAIPQFRLSIDILKVMDNGRVPPAFLGVYAWRLLKSAAASIGCGRVEDGYRLLDECFDVLRQWHSFPEDAVLPVGSEELFGGLCMVKGKPILVHKDGHREYLSLCCSKWDLIGPTKDFPYNAMFNRRGWEWFSPEWDTPRFEAYIQKAKELAMS